MRTYMLDLLRLGERPARKGRGPDWAAIAVRCDVEETRLRSARGTIQFAFDAFDRASRRSPARTGQAKASRNQAKRPLAQLGSGSTGEAQLKPVPPPDTEPAATGKRRPGAPRRAVVEFPEPLFEMEDPTDFQAALDLHMRRHGDSCRHLHRAVVRPEERTDMRTITDWRRGKKCPRTVESMVVLGRIERRYRLPEGYFKAKLPHPARSAVGHPVAEIGAAERRRLAWHLPDDFGRRPAAEQEEILAWVRAVIVSGATDYRRFQAAAMKYRYALRFPSAGAASGSIAEPENSGDACAGDEDGDPSFGDPEARPGATEAPPELAEEMAALVRFKTAKLTAFGYQRMGVWGDETAAQKTEHMGLMFGALAASPSGPVRGRGLPREALSFGMLVFPAVWDWYVQWRERRRGFHTAWEVDMLRVSLALTREETGWLRQTPSLARRLRPIPGLISADDVERARGDWGGACNDFRKYATGRVREIARIARVHRDPFEPILPVLEAPSPVGEYRKITEEILRLMPDERRYPKAAAEAVRAFLLLRLGLHLGLRQKNLRQLLVCGRGSAPTSERRLEDMKCGELRWSERDAGWEVLIPAAAFKNAHSSFFARKPFRLVLPDLGRLYEHVDSYISRHRKVLLGGAADPGTFFVKTAKASSVETAYNQTTFYEAWRLAIQRYGIFNPYTGRGAIKGLLPHGPGAIRGLLPHGPHNVRDVLATHILKQTGSYEQASYAIQDTPEMVAQHYGRFLPQDKAGLAARILNQVWEAA
jgi:integrase